MKGERRKLWEAGEQIQELTERIEAALGLLESEEADAIIGESTPEHRTLIQGAEALMTMQWAVMKQDGVEETQSRLRHQAQAMQMVLVLVHIAYALGMRRGSEK